jgi:succinate dehydrogenase / fumarate reductase cytochrome b subunit
MEDIEKPAVSAPAGEPRWRRLHSRAGTSVLAAFVALHLLSNASALGGEAWYARIAGAVQRSAIAPLLSIVVLGAVVLHAGYGLGLLCRRDGAAEAAARYGDRTLWQIQRATAALLIVFVAAHLWELRIQQTFRGLDADAFHTLLAAHLSSTWGGVPWTALGYVLGVGAAAYHAASGVLAATADRAAPAARRRARIATAVLGGLLFLIGSATVVGLATGTVLLPARDLDTPCGSAAEAAPTR